MSGKKHYHVDMSAWFRTRIRQGVRSLLDPVVLDDLAARTRADLQQDLAEMRGRQAAMEQAVQQLGEQARVVEQRTSERLREQLSDLEHQLGRRQDALAAEIRTDIEERDRALRADITSVREQARLETEKLRSEIRADRQRAEASARQWLTDATAMRDLIARTLPHDRYAPGELARLDAQLATAAGTLQQGHFEAALAGSQGVFHALSDLRLDLELRHREWIMLRAAAIEALSTVQASAERSERRPIHGANGAELVGAVLDVDHWSRGELSVLRAKLDDALDAVRADDTPMSIEDLRRVVETSGPEYERRLDEIVETAERRLVGSQLRVNVAEEVVQTLDRVAGYVFDGGRYNHEDYRESYYTKLTHPNGNQIVVEVAPDEASPQGSTVRVLSYDHDIRSEDLRRARARDIADSLRRRGLDVGDPIADPGEPDPQYIELATPTPRQDEVPAEHPSAG